MDPDSEGQDNNIFKSLGTMLVTLIGIVGLILLLLLLGLLVKYVEM